MPVLQVIFSSRYMLKQPVFYFSAAGPNVLSGATTEPEPKAVIIPLLLDEFKMGIQESIDFTEAVLIVIIIYIYELR